MLNPFKLFNPLWLITNIFTLYGGGKDGGDAPDYEPVAKASERAAEIGAELGREQLAENRRQADRNFAVAQPVIQRQAALMDQQQAQGDDYFNYMKQFSRPAETALFYEAFGLNPDEISEIESLRASETEAGRAQAASRATVSSMPTFVDVPTSTIKTNVPKGAVKGSSVSGKVITGFNEQNIMGHTFNGGPIMGKLDPDAYYVKGADGAYTQVQPTFTNEQGTKQVAIPGVSTPASSGVIDTPKTSARLAELTAKAGLRQQDEAANAAIADSRKGYTNAANIAARTGLRYGFSADKMASAMDGMSVDQAQNQAAAASGARDRAKNLGYAKKLDVAGLYRNLPGASQAAYGLTLNAGNSAVANQNATSAQYLNGMNAGTNTIMNGQQMNLNGQSAILSAQNSAYNAGRGDDGLFSTLGTLGGAAISKWSDKDVKKDIKETDDHEALEAVKMTPVSSWKYDADKIDGQDNDTHVGPMAQDVHKNMGEKAAPTGRMVDLISLNGINMAAIRALSKEVDALKKKGGK